MRTWEGSSTDHGVKCVHAIRVEERSGGEELGAHGAVPHGPGQACVGNWELLLPQKQNNVGLHCAVSTEG